MRHARIVPGGDEVDALVTDQYLDALLASGGAPARDGGAVEPVAGIRHAGDVVSAALVRVHPSFRFEERLADRLAQLAATGAAQAVASGRGAGAVIPFPGSSPVESDDPLLDAVMGGRLDPADAAAVARAMGARPPARPLIVGGAITSAAISIAGVAWVAWRASRPGHAPMGRAARAAHARRLADLAGVPGGPA